MPEIRTDSISGRQVIFAPERARRPFEHSGAAASKTLDRCPFCAGNEDATPDAVLTLPDRKKSTDWQVRIVPNRYPAVGETESRPSIDPFFGVHAAPGRHEVIIESPGHETAMYRLSPLQFGLVLRAWRQRMQEIRDERIAAHVTLFKNNGAAAGASLEHVHSQLLAIPFVPPAVEDELSAGAEFLRTHGSNAWLENLEREVSAGERIVSDFGTFVVFCPFASRFPAEMWIVPRRHCPDFTEATDEELDVLASILKESLTRLDQLYSDAACNLVVHTAPFTADERRDSMQWHIQITPRLTGIAGFEIGAGSWVNIVTPEDASARLRDAL